MTWLPMLGAAAVATAILIVPGALALTAIGPRRWTTFALAPLVSVAILGVAGIAASVVGLTWSVLPVMVMTAVVWGIARGIKFLDDRRTGRASVDHDPVESTPGATWPWALIGLLLGAVLIARRLPTVFGVPDGFSQSFDNIFHLNALRHIVETGDASALSVGSLTGVGFYPAGWHAVGALVVQITGVDVAVSANALTVAISAVVWPLSVLALTAVAMPRSRSALVAAGVVASGFGAFPLLLVAWGILYPNSLAVAMLPAAVALVASILLRPEESLLTGKAVRYPVEAAAVLAAVGGLGIAHPQGLLAWLVLTSVIGVVAAARAVRTSWGSARRVAWRAVAIAAAGSAATFLILQMVRPPADQAWWPTTLTQGQAVGEGLTVSVVGLPTTWALTLLVWLGVWVVLRTHGSGWLAALFGMTVWLYAVAAGGPQWLRDLITAVWNNDANRLAALIPLAAAPLAAIGAAHLGERIGELWAASPFAARMRDRHPAVGRAVVGVSAVVVLALVVQGDNVRLMASRAAGTFVVDRQSQHVDSYELTLIRRLEETVPEGALIVGSPRTGVPFAYSLGGREVLPMHIFGPRSDDLLVLTESLRDIESTPAVCPAVSRLGVDYVLDFGSRDLQGRDDDKEYDGVEYLRPSERLELVDQEGHARLFRVNC